MYRGVAQLVSAPALGAGGPQFESEYPDMGAVSETQPPFSSERNVRSARQSEPIAEGGTLSVAQLSAEQSNLRHD